MSVFDLKDNANMDREVLSALRRDTPMTFSSILAHMENLPHTGFAWRAVDRSLQRLRKGGKIRFGGHKTGWYIPIPKP